ncbi:unnamed protein product [Effrenium voratum]|uniref:Uncharacterized protein n=1 Tax=Effrenium voratum TaxID=2562239 RepID=A0AA36HZF5_9DINO|nr:unnamed protein product [Effrenium voratum]CAJ1433968.1 unnamed protein product [Effrenium voratum]
MRQGQGKWDASDCEQNDNNWYLVDALDKHPTGKLPAKTVTACSPDRQHYSNCIKDGGECVYMEAWKTQELRGPWEFGGALRILLAGGQAHTQAGKLQDSEANDFATVQYALCGDLDTMGTKLPSRLFTNLSVDGISCKVAVCSAWVKSLLAEKHFAELVIL